MRLHRAIGSAALVLAGLGAGCGGGEEEPPFEEGPDTSDELLGYDAFPELAIELSDEAIASLEAEPRVYVPADLTFDGVTHRVGLRLKGQNSFQPIGEKPAFRIKVDEYDPDERVASLKDIVLNNMVNDPSMMHERLAYLVAREAGLPASRATHALVTVNGELYGLYTALEAVKKRMLKRWFDDEEGPLFEAADVDFAAQYIDSYELESGEDDRSALAGLAAALELADPDDAIAAAGEHADVDQLVRFWAMCAVIGQFDSFPYSNPGDDYFVYVDPVDRKIRVLPWGMDETFFAADHDILAITSVFATTCMASADCYRSFREQVYEVLALTEALDLEGERVRVAEQIAPHVVDDTRKPYPTEMVFDLQAAQGYFIRERRMWIDTYLEPD
jgi:hypothetical protein